jgi:hypothetical protein
VIVAISIAENVALFPPGWSLNKRPDAVIDKPLKPARSTLPASELISQNIEK